MCFLQFCRTVSSHLTKLWTVTIFFRLLVNADCEEKRPFICMTKSLETNQEPVCPKNFYRYKNSCYYHSMMKGDYNASELICAKRGSRVVTIKDRAAFQFIRALAWQDGFGSFYLGVNYTTGDANNPVKYSDGSSFNKSSDYAFDDNAEKFGNKECNFLKSGIKFKPRDTECDVEMSPLCIWNSKIISF